MIIKIMNSYVWNWALFWSCKQSVDKRDSTTVLQMIILAILLKYKIYSHWSVKRKQQKERGQVE